MLSEAWRLVRDRCYTRQTRISGAEPSSSMQLNGSKLQSSTTYLPEKDIGIANCGVTPASHQDKIWKNWGKILNKKIENAKPGQSLLSLQFATQRPKQYSKP